MRRDQFSVAVKTDDGPLPTLDVAYDGPTAALDARLAVDGESLDSDDIDAAFRLVDPLESDAEGVFSLAHRLTGTYLFELNAMADDIIDLVGTARERAAGNFRVRVGHREGVTVYDMDALFVYDEDGELLRQHSLIPSGVEL